MTEEDRCSFWIPVFSEGDLGISPGSKNLGLLAHGLI